MRSNFNLLVNEPVVSASREKAIQTMMTTRGITRDEAIEIQALRIVQSQARKK